MDDNDLAFFTHVGEQLPNYRFGTIFDVGANIGQSCIPFAGIANDAKIYAFEPVQATFQLLADNTARHDNISVFNLALGETEGLVKMQAKGTSTSNRILENTPLAHRGLDVPISTGEKFRDTHGIDHVSFLKIDTEGHDLAVLRGFGKGLQTVDFIQVEASMNPSNTRHVDFRLFLDYLNPLGFYLFHVYDQTFEFHDGGRPWVRRSNPVFIRAAIAGPAMG